MIKAQTHETIDKLTGLRNYDSFTVDFDTLAAAAMEKCEDLSLITLDIDRFLYVNEEYGRNAGDEVIKALANHLRQSLPGIDFIYRYGGDQFAVLLLATQKEQAFLLMEKAREAFCQIGRIQTDKGELALNITFSAGVACCPEDGSRMAEIVRKADGALFRAKAGGANRVCLSREEKMITKTSHYTYEQLQRLAQLSKKEGMGEAILLREALDDLLKKYDH